MLPFVVLTCVLAVLPSVGVGAQEPSPEPTPEEAPVAPVRVAVREIAPFAMVEDGDWSGYSIDAWEDVAAKGDIDFEYVEVATVQEQLDEVSSGRADAALGAVSVTRQREQVLDFTHPFYDSGIGILVSDQVNVRGLGDLLGSILTRALLWLLVVFIVLVVIMGHVVWLVERRRNSDHFPHDYAHGVVEGMWWAVVTMTTVGYGDTVARTRAGRLVAVVWMLVGLVLVAQFTAAVTSSLTVEKFDGVVRSIGDLYGRDVVTVAGTTSQDYLDTLDLPALAVPDVDAAVQELLEGRADAVVFDEPVLRYQARTTANGQAHMVPKTYQPQSIAMAWRDGDPHIEQVDLALLGMREEGVLETLDQQWFGTE